SVSGCGSNVPTRRESLSTGSITLSPLTWPWTCRRRPLNLDGAASWLDRHAKEEDRHERRNLRAAARLRRGRRIDSEDRRAARLRVVVVRRTPDHAGRQQEPLPGLGRRRYPGELLALR